MLTSTEVLSKSLLVWSRNAPAAVSLSLLAHSPLLAYTWFASDEAARGSSDLGGAVGFAFTTFVMASLALFFTQGAMTAAVMRTLNDEPVDDVTALTRGLHAMRRTSGLSLLSGSRSERLFWRW